VPFSCSICEQESTRICGFCTKDACDMHICERCGCCSDCCQCEVPLDEPVPMHPEAPLEHAVAASPEPIVETSQPATSGAATEPLGAAWAPAEAQTPAPEESGFESLETPEG
jgi:hypothetical protein